MQNKKGRIIKFPISDDTRLKNSLGRGAVQCWESDRWLKLYRSISHLETQDNKIIPNSEQVVIFAHVMTIDKNNKERELCRLILDENELMSALEEIKKHTSRA